MDLNKIWGLFSGKKSYLVAALMALCVFALNIGWIDKATHDNLLSLLTAAGLGTLRAGIEAKK